jgi:hypothetical protein
MRQDLRDEALAKIEDYLGGRCTKREATAWAIQTLRRTAFPPERTLLEDAITALAGLHDEDQRLDTAREDLMDYYDRLKAEVLYPAVDKDLASAVAEDGEPYE